MIFDINRLEMLAAAKKAARVAPKNSPLEVLNGVLIECGDDAPEIFMTATNHESSIQCKTKASIMEAGSILTDATRLVDMLTLLSGEMVELSSERPDFLRVAAGKAVYNVRCLPANHFPKPVMPFPEDTVKIKGICTLYRKTEFATAKDNNKPVLQCVSVKLKGDRFHAAACDGTKVILAKGDAESDTGQDFLLPVQSLRQLAAVSTDEDVYEVGDVGKEIVFTKENMIFSMKKMPGEFIDVMKTFKSITPKYFAMTEAKSLYTALDDISVCAGRQPINLVMTGGNILLSCDGDLGAAHTHIAANITADTPESGFYYNPDWLLKALQVLNGKVKIEIDGQGFLLVKNMSEVYLQLPVRKPVKDDKKTKAKDVKAADNEIEKEAA